MEKVISYLLTNTDVLLGVIIGLIGIIISIVLYFLGIRKAKLRYIRSDLELISTDFNQIKGLEIKYSNEKTDNASISKIAIWNKGNKTLRSLSMAKKDPLRIYTTKGKKILSYNLMTESKNVNDVKLKLINNILYIYFEYFDKKDGCVIKILHDGTENDIKIAGSFEEIGEIKKSKTILSNRFIFFIMIGFLGIISGYYMSSNSPSIIVYEKTITSYYDSTLSIKENKVILDLNLSKKFKDSLDIKGISKREYEFLMLKAKSSDSLSFNPQKPFTHNLLSYGIKDNTKFNLILIISVLLFVLFLYYFFIINNISLPRKLKRAFVGDEKKEDKLIDTSLNITLNK